MRRWERGREGGGGGRGRKKGCFFMSGEFEMRVTLLPAPLEGSNVSHTQIGWHFPSDLEVCHCTLFF